MKIIKILTVTMGLVVVLSACGKKTTTSELLPKDDVTEIATESMAMSDENHLSVTEIEDLVVDYFTKTYTADGNFVVFGSETTQTKDDYRITVRFQSNSETIMANTLVEIVSVDKETCEMFINDDFVWDLND